MPSTDWHKWESEARKAEKQSFQLDAKAHSFPIEPRLFLEAANIARESARYYLLAMQSTTDLWWKSIALANYYVSIGNSYKSLGNFFYYSEKPARAANFFEKGKRTICLV